jgi:hypothetical protein
LNWRFVARPDATYTRLVATCGSDVVGYLILRSAEKDGVRWGYLVDFLVEGPSPSLLALLIDEAVERLRKERAVAVMSFASAPAYQRALSRQGFYLWPWGSRASLYTRVEPPDPTWQAFQDVRQSFWTMGDGDLDALWFSPESAPDAVQRDRQNTTSGVAPRRKRESRLGDGVLTDNSIPPLSHTTNRGQHSSWISRARSSSVWMERLSASLIR